MIQGDRRGEWCMKNLPKIINKVHEKLEEPTNQKDIKPEDHAKCNKAEETEDILYTPKSISTPPMRMPPRNKYIEYLIRGDTTWKEGRVMHAQPKTQK